MFVEIIFVYLMLWKVGFIENICDYDDISSISKLKLEIVGNFISYDFV